MPSCSVVVRDMAVGEGSLGLDSRARQIGRCRQRLATAELPRGQVMILRHSLHALRNNASRMEI